VALACLLAVAVVGASVVAMRGVAIMALVSRRLAAVAIIVFFMFFS